MKAMQKSQLAVLLGVALLLLAISVSAVPVFGTGSRLLGGDDERFYLCWYDMWTYIGCWDENMDCVSHCVGTRWSYCFAAYNAGGRRQNCTGGSVLTAIPQGAGGGEGYATSWAGCDGPAWSICGSIYHAGCTY